MKKVFIIAEAGVNHNGLIKNAMELISAAAEAKADAIKFQTFKTENLLTCDAPKANYQKENTGITETQFEMIKKLELSLEEHEKLINYSRRKKIVFLSSPFDLESLDLLANSFKLEILKIPSGEITNPLLLLKAAQSRKKIILSTGMSTLAEIETALSILAFGFLNLKEKATLKACRKAYLSPKGQKLLKANVTLLHCTTEYPTDFKDVNLRVMKTLGQAFGLKVGISDHSRGIFIPIAAVALGATVVEKHFTLDKSLPGPDHKASIEPDELKSMVEGVRSVEKALGLALKLPSPTEEMNKLVARKSLVALNQIAEGSRFTENNLGLKRPGNGISPLRYWEFLGKKATKNFSIDEIISEK